MIRKIGLLEFWFTLRMVKNLQASWKIDLIHAHFAQPDGIAVSRISNKLQLPYLITEHKGRIQDYFAIPSLKKQLAGAYRKARKVICVSDFLHHLLEQTFNLQSNLITLPNCLDPRAFSVKEKAPQPRKMIFVGNLTPDKGLQYLLPALRHLLNEGYELSLVIVGSGGFLTPATESDQEPGAQFSSYFPGLCASS